MTHPTRIPAPLTLAEAVARISDRDMTEMCLAINTTLGPTRAWALAELITAARNATDAAKRG